MTAALTCDWCLAGRHIKCRGCGCLYCEHRQGGPRAAQETRPRPKPAVPVSPKKPRARAAPRAGGTGRMGPRPMTPGEEAEVRKMVLQLVEGIANRVGAKI